MGMCLQNRLIFIVVPLLSFILLFHFLYLFLRFNMREASRFHENGISREFYQYELSITLNISEEFPNVRKKI